LEARRGDILLVEEPDAHLEAPRQREVYDLLAEVVERRAGQVIVVTQSEALLNGAAQENGAVAFVGQPHGIHDRDRRCMPPCLLGREGPDGQGSMSLPVDISNERDSLVSKGPQTVPRSSDSSRPSWSESAAIMPLALFAGVFAAPASSWRTLWRRRGSSPSARPRRAA